MLGFTDIVVMHVFVTTQQILKCQVLIVLCFAAVLIIKDLKNVSVCQVKHVKFMYRPLNVILYQVRCYRCFFPHLCLHFLRIKYHV